MGSNSTCTFKVRCNSKTQRRTTNHPNNSQRSHDTLIRFPLRESSLGSTRRKQRSCKCTQTHQKVEATKVCYKLLRKYLSPSTRSGITRIKVANKEGTTRIVTEPNEVFSLIWKGTMLTSVKLLGLRSQHRHPATGWANVEKQKLENIFLVDATNLISDLLAPFRKDK